MNRETTIFTICGFLVGLILGGLVIGPRVYEAQQKSRIASPEASAPFLQQAGVAPQAAALSDNAAPAMDAVRTQIQNLKQQVEKNPDDAGALVQLGNLYMDAAKFPQAIDFYQRAMKIAPQPDVLTDLGICYRNAGQLDTALSTFREARQANPRQWQALFNEAVVLADLKRFDEARNAVAQVEKEHPGDPDVGRFSASLQALR